MTLVSVEQILWSLRSLRLVDGQTLYGFTLAYDANVNVRRARRSFLLLDLEMHTIEYDQYSVFTQLLLILLTSSTTK